MKLPHVTPAQIIVSRCIKKAFTGHLDAPMISFPIFPGNEMNYLRCQIARITCTTHISPSGYFVSMEDEDEDEDQESETLPTFFFLFLHYLYHLNISSVPAAGVIEHDPDFMIGKISDLADISSWSHHTPFLLPQGRTIWWNPMQKLQDEFDEDEDDEDEKEQLEELEPQNGPPLLTSAAEDASKLWRKRKVPLSLPNIHQGVGVSVHLSTHSNSHFSLATVYCYMVGMYTVITQDYQVELKYNCIGFKYLCTNGTTPVLTQL